MMGTNFPSEVSQVCAASLMGKKLKYSKQSSPPSDCAKEEASGKTEAFFAIKAFSKRMKEGSVFPLEKRRG